MTQDEMNSCIFTNTVDRSEDDSPPVCLVELVNSKAKSSENHGPVELCVDKLKKSSHESTSNACVPKDIDDKTASLLPEINDLESETHLAILKLEDNANNGIQVAVSTGPIDLDNAYSSTVKEPNSPKPNDNTTKGVNEMPISGRHSLSDSKQPSCDLNVEDEDDLDLEDRPLTVDTQGVDDISPIESENSVVNVVNNSLLSNISSTITENTQASITTVPEVSEASVSVISTMSLPDLASSSSSFSSSLPTHPNLHPMSASNKSYSSDRHHTSTPVALATVAPIRMSSVGPDYTISNESLRSIKPTPQDVVTSPTMCVHSSIPSSVTKHEVGTVSSSSSVSYSSKSSNQPNTVEVSSFSSPSMTNSISTGTTSIPISITPIIGTCAMNTMNMSSIFSVRGRPAVGQSVLPLLSVGPQPTPSFTSQTSLPSLPSQSGVHFMPFIGSMSATLPVSVGNTSLKNIINPSSGIPIPAGTPAVPCPPLQIFNMTPVPQFVGPPSFVLHPTGPIPCPNSFQFPQASAHLLPAGGGGLGGTAFNFLQPSQNYAGTMFSQNLNNNLSGDLLIDTQNPLSLGHSVLAAPPPSASIAVIGGAINNPTSSSTSSPLTSLYPTIFHPVNQNFFSTSCTHSSPPGCYPYSTGLLGGTNLVNTTTPQMAASVSNLPHFLHNSNETTNFMLQSVPPAPPPSAGGGTSFLSTNFTQNTPGHLYQSCQYPTFHNLFQTNDLISSGVPSTVTCDSKPPVSNDGTCCVSTYWPLMISSEDMMMTTTTTTTPTSMVVQMSSSLTSSQTSDWNVESGMKNKVADSHIDHITSSSSNRLNYSCASLNETSAANVMRPINSPLKDTFSSLPTTANNTAANTTNHDDIVNDKSSSNASSCLPPPTTTTVILPVIRRRRRLFVHNGIKPITNIIQSPMITNDTFVNDDSSTGLMINTSVNTEVDISINAVDITATTTTSISKHYHHTDNVNTSNNDAGNIHRKNEKNELEQSNPSQFSGVPRAHLQLSTVITMNNNDTLEEDIQLSNKSSSISAESIPKLSKNHFLK
ncbi:unnamed protein product [Heterobilharzia americana]|nr:unnamed protein product [Heterobilharzia americana]